MQVLPDECIYCGATYGPHRAPECTPVREDRRNDAMWVKRANGQYAQAGKTHGGWTVWYWNTVRAGCADSSQTFAHRSEARAALLRFA